MDVVSRRIQGIHPDGLRHDEGNGLGLEFPAVARRRAVVAVVQQLMGVLVRQRDELRCRCEGGKNPDSTAARRAECATQVGCGLQNNTATGDGSSE